MNDTIIVTVTVIEGTNQQKIKRTVYEGPSLAEVQDTPVRLVGQLVHAATDALHMAMVDAGYPIFVLKEEVELIS